MRAEPTSRDVPDRGYQDLVAWQKAMQLVRDVYRPSRTGPRDEQFGLTNQIRRAAVSVPSNIAEGSGRTGRPEFLHHLSLAHGSLCEGETQLLIARDLEYIEAQSFEMTMQRSREVGRLIRGLIKSLR